MTWAPAEINLAASGFFTTATATATALASLAACLLVSDMARGARPTDQAAGSLRPVPHCSRTVQSPHLGDRAVQT